MGNGGRGAVLVAVLLGVLLAAGAPAGAWSGPSGGSGPRVVEAEDRVGARRATTGNLRVAITGIRAGAAHVVVTGARGFSRRLNRTTTLRALRPGRYKVTARTVRLAAGTAAPTRATRYVSVVRNRTAGVTVTYLPPLPYTGVLTLAVTTPAGVPGTVRATGPGPALLSAKAPSGTSVTRSFRVKPGTWVVTPDPVSYGGTLYRAAPTTVSVRRGATTKATTTYTAVPAVAGVGLTALTSDSLTVGWTTPAGVDEVVARVAEGQTAPASRTDGADVPVSGQEATATGLTAATVHSVSVFSRSGSTWFGPLTVQGSTRAAVGPSTDPAAAFALQPGTWAPPSGAELEITARDDGRLDVVFPAPPPLGQAVVLSDRPGLPGGYVGVVQQVGAGNLGVVGRAGLDRAYEYLDVEVPDLAAVAGTLRPSGAAGQRLRRAAADLVECSGGTNASITATPSLSPYGHVSLQLATSASWTGVSVGLDFDVAVGLTLDLPLTASVTGEVSCEQQAIGPFNWPFAVGVVPLLLRAEPALGLAASGTVTATTGLTVSGGMSASGYLPVKGIGLDGARVDDADATGSGTFHEVEGQVEASLTAYLGGRIDFGVGVGTPTGSPVDSGALGGLTGYLTVAELTVTAKPTTDPAGCLETTATYGGGVGLTARAWFDDYEVDANLPLLDWSRPYPGTPIFRPESCAPKVWSGTESWTVHIESSHGRGIDASFTRRWLQDGGETFVEEYGVAQRGYGACTETIGPISGGPERSLVEDRHRLRYDDMNGRLAEPAWHRNGYFVIGAGYSPASGIRYSGCGEDRDYTGVDFCDQHLIARRVCGQVASDALPAPDGNTFVFEETVACTPELCPTEYWGESYDGYVTLKIRLTGEQDSDGDGLPDSTDPDPSTPSDP